MNNDPTYQQPLCSPCATCDESNTTTTRKQDDNETKTTSNGTVKCVPQKRFPEFQNEGEWETVSFADLFSLLSNNTLSRAELSTEGEGIYNIHYGDILIKYPSYVDIQKTTLPCIKEANKISNIANVQLQDGDIVIADTAEDEIAGKCIEIGNVNDKVVVAGLHTIPCRPNKRFAPAYLGYYMNSHCFHSKLLPIMQGAKVTSISRSALKKVTITYPSSLEEQQMIASCLLSIDDDISATTQKLEQLKMHKKALSQSLFPQQGKIYPQYHFNNFQNTGAWEETIVEHAIKTITPPKKLQSKEYRTTGAIPIIDQSQAYICGYSDDETAIMNKDSQELIIFGDHTCALKLVDFPFIQGADGIKIFKSKNKKRLDTKFLYYLLQCFHIEPIAYKRHFSELKSEKILFPSSIKEQQKIADSLQSIDDEIYAITNKLVLLKSQKDALLQQLFPHL